VQPHGSIAAIGLAGGAELNTTVMPFILRGVNLLGINSAYCSAALRSAVWQRLGGDMRPPHLQDIAGETVGLDGLPRIFERMMDGRVQGRVVVRM
ncbi:MAG: oxidoreductase, partial [Acidihalobacter sp.]